MSESSARSVVLVGASVRALAFAVLRAGWLPWCADLFADSDLQLHAVCHRLRGCEYPHAIPNILARYAPAAPILYTGKLEHYPHLLERLKHWGSLWGNPPAVVTAVRDPHQLQTVLAALGLPFATWRQSDDDVPTDGSWVVRTAQGVRRWLGQPLSAPPHYWQRYIPGEPASAVYLADQRHCVCLGATWQLVGQSWCYAREFQWCGNLGPMPCTQRLQENLQHLGEGLARSFGLQGVFGVDFILQDEVPWVTEINPRYPASLEVLELAKPCPWFAAHAALFAAAQTCAQSPAAEESFVPGNEPFASADCRKPTTNIPTPFVGKAILFAPKPLSFVRVGVASLAPILTPFTLGFDRALADVPNEGEVIAARAPLLTILAQADTPDSCFSRLQQLASDIYSQLRVSHAS